MPKITYLPSQKSFDCVTGTNVFAQARAEQITVETACGGKGTCGLCRVKIIAGAEHLPPPSFEEKRFTGSSGALRLSCRLNATHDLTVEVPPPRPKKVKTK